ncbi:hypothetical protein LTR17_015745 [Elasticomyces elasticus]|nr:hypothetical protein LTR17_015745 [Elasticomyces elasticus]
MAIAARDRGYINPHTSADSSYGSTSHSRVSSEQMNLQDWGRPHLPRDCSGFLLEPSLSEELAQEPAFPEASFEADETVETPETAPKQPENVLKNGRAYQSQLDPSNALRSMNASKSGWAAQKQTRFEQTLETAKSRQQDDHLQLLQSASRQYLQSQYLPEVVQDSQPESATLPQPKLLVPAQRSMALRAACKEPSPSFSAPVGQFSPPLQRYQDPQSQYTLPARTSIPPPARDREKVAPPVRLSSRSPQHPHTASLAPLKRIISPSLRSSQPLTGSLEGLEVNKRGKILGEEGEIMGELVEGDIMDCVRQRCSAYSEVLDDRGRVVGCVHSLEHTLDSPIMRVASPGPSPAPVVQQQHDFAPQIQQSPPRSETPSERRKPRPESVTSQREVFAPAWQRLFQNKQASLAWQLRDHIVSVDTQPDPAVTLAEYRGESQLSN